uniref:Tudor domain containing 15 n=1 Tax=Mastacembelus armatus TaxID=205130 RepID=A0A7N8YJ21_9TELE
MQVKKIPCALWPVDLKITHLDWNTEAVLIHFQGQYLTICELDYSILQGEIQNLPKTKTAVDIGEFCLVEDLTSARWYRGRVQNRKQDLFEVFLIDHGNALSVDISHISSCSNDLFILPPKIVCGFLANVLFLQGCAHSVIEEYFSRVIGTNVTGYIQGLLPHKILLLEAPDINNDLVTHGLGRHVDTDTFLLLVEMLTEVPLKQNTEPVPDLLIEKPRGQEFCFKPSSLHAYEEILSFCGPRLSCGTHAKVRVTAAVNPGLFYCQMASMETDLWEMSKKLAAVCEYRAKERHQMKEAENLGLLCSVKGKDGKWYRGFVQFLPVNSQVRVLFIDYGFFESVKVENVHRLPPDFDSAPIVAFPCSLCSLNDQDEAVRTQQLSFLKAGLLGEVLHVEIKSFDEEQNLYYITITGTEDKHAKKPKPNEDLPREKDESLYETEDSPQVDYLYYETIMKKTRSLKYSVTSDVSGNIVQQEEEENMCKKDVKPAQTPVIFRPLNIRPGCEFAVRCSYISSPSDFWCQPLDQVPALEELMDKVQQYYLTHTAPIQSGDSCCVARSPLDARWYRAIITEKQKGQARVISVDYGFTIQIKEHNLQAVQPEYMLLEGQAFRCNLYNLIEPTDLENCGDWSPEACNLMKDFVHDNTSTLRCKVVSQLNVKNKGPCNVVDLYNSQTQQSITDMLVEQSLARRVTVSTKQLSTVFPESFVYSSFDLCSGNEVQVYVTHVSSQCEVYCQLERNTEMFEELEKKISEESENMMRTSTKPVLRRLCLAKYLDGKWYRGLAHPVQSPQHFRVFFVDYGNTGISEKTHVMFIPRDSAYLLYTPMQALRCSLASVSKKELYADVKDWLVAAVLNKLVRAVIVAKREDDSFDVELFDGDVNINKKVNDLIVGLTPKPKTVTSFDKSKPKKDYIKTSVKLKSQPAFSPRCYIQRDTQVRSAPQQKQKNTRKYVRRRTNTNVKKQNENRTQSPVPIHPQENTKAKERERGDLNAKETKVPQLSCLPEKKLNPGFRAECFVSHIDSVNSFFLQDSLKTTTSLTISDLVLAEYEDDGALYRSVLRDYEGTSCFKVEFIDYGNSAVVGKEKIYLIPKDYLSQPRFSIPCFLLDKNTYENHASFTDAVMDKRLMVDFVRQRESCWEVKIETLDREFGLPSAREAAGESSSADENKEGSLATEGEHNLDASPPQQLVFASVAIDTAYIGFAAAVTNPSEFCLVLEDLLLVMNQMSVMLDELPGQLSPLPEAHLIPGTCCLFKSVSKNKWCRAEIVNADATVVLNLVDYGYCDCLLYKDCSQLKRLPEELINLPKVTFPCILRGVKPVEADGQWTDEGAVFFQHCLYQKNLQIFFREFVSDVHWKSDLASEATVEAEGNMPLSPVPGFKQCQESISHFVSALNENVLQTAGK